MAKAQLRVMHAGVYTLEGFKAALSVVLAYAAYLPSARCFVLLPLLSQVTRTPCLSCKGWRLPSALSVQLVGW